MTDLARFTTVAGEDVIFDLEQVTVCWEGKSAGCTIFYVMGLDDPIEVAVDFDRFVLDWLDVYDCRQGKKKPRRSKRQGSSPVKLVAGASKVSRHPTPS